MLPLKQTERYLFLNEEENGYVAEWGTAKDCMHSEGEFQVILCHTISFSLSLKYMTEHLHKEWLLHLIEQIYFPDWHSVYTCQSVI